MNQVKNKFEYKIYCLSDDEAKTTEFVFTGPDSRMRQMNTQTNFKRIVTRFDRPCEKPQQAGLVSQIQK